MRSVKLIQRVIDQLRAGTLSDQDISTLLRNPSPVVRANAFDAIAKRAEVDDNLLNDLFASVSGPANEVRLMGTTKVSGVAICALLRTGRGRAIEFAREHVAELNDTDRADLAAYLASEGVNAGPK